MRDGGTGLPGTVVQGWIAHIQGIPVTSSSVGKEHSEVVQKVACVDVLGVIFRRLDFGGSGRWLCSKVRTAILVTCTDTVSSSIHDRHCLPILSLFPTKPRLNLRISLNPALPLPDNFQLCSKCQPNLLAWLF
jgi:hypothetical protein